MAVCSKACCARLLIYSLLVTSILVANSGAYSSEKSDSYTFGVVPQFEQRKLFSTWKPILDELNRSTGLMFVLSGSPKIPVFEKRFIRGEFDFAYMNPYHVLKAHASQGYIPLVRDGENPLHGILVVSKNSPIKTITELKGATIAFPSPNALGASLLMRADLQRLHGITVIPRYVQTHSSVYLHVLQNLTAAGGGVARTLDTQPLAVKDGLKIIYTTRPMAPHPIVAHPRVAEGHRKQVQQALLNMAKTPSGQALLAKIPLRAPLTATMNDYRLMGGWGLEAFYEDDIIDD